MKELYLCLISWQRSAIKEVGKWLGPYVCSKARVVKKCVMTWPGIVGNYRFYPFTQGYIYKKICVGIVLDKKCF